MLQAVGSDGVAAGAFQIVSQLSTIQVNANNTTTPIEQITFYDVRYGVTATFNVLNSVYQADGARNLVAERVAQLEALCAEPHVVAARGAQDQDPASGILYNYLVLTVGTPDFARTSEVWVRMDHLGTPAAFGAIAQAVKLQNDLGPTAQLTV
jgi:hypothetical protein